MRSKKYRALALIFISTPCFGVLPQSDQEKLPLLRNIGVLPLQVESDFTDSKDLIQKLDTWFKQAAHEVKRFHMLQDDLIKSYYDSPSGRNELVSRYELSGFMSLSFSKRNDTIILVARLLSSDFEPFLQESDSFSWVDFRSLEAQKIEKVVKELTFRLLNRIPLDVFITSIQGRFVTLSGGENHGINHGNRFALKRIYVAERHPAHHSWQRFHEQAVGEMQIIDVREKTSVGEMVSLVETDNIQIGDGIKVEAVPTRAYFDTEFSKNPLVHDAPEPILLSSTSVEPFPTLTAADHAVTEQIQTSESIESMHDENNDNEINVSPSSQSKVVLPSSSASVKKSANNHPQKTSEASHIPDVIGFHGGLHLWEFQGGAKSKSEEVWYMPINTLGLEMEKHFLPNIDYDLSFEIGFGKTHDHGSYISQQTRGRIFYKDSKPWFPAWLHLLKGGAHATIATLSVQGEGFGGMDRLQGGLYGGAEGELAVDLKKKETKTFQYFIDALLTPLTLGRIGYGGSYKSMRSSLGWQLSAGAFEVLPPNALEWGGAFEYSAFEAVDTGGFINTAHQMAFFLMGRWRN